MRIGYFDLETWDLSPEFGPILCGSVLSLPEEKMVTFRNDHYVEQGKADGMADDRALAVDLRDFLSDHHLLVAWHGKGFDCPLLNTRLVKWDQEQLPRRLFLDPMYYFRGWRGLKPKSSSLENVAKFFQLVEEKLEVKPDTWLEARGGDSEAMDVAQERCESDVRLLREVTERAFDNCLVKNIQSYP